MRNYISDPEPLKPTYKSDQPKRIMATMTLRIVSLLAVLATIIGLGHIIVTNWQSDGTLETIKNAPSQQLQPPS